MNEIPETLILARQIQENLTGKTITAVTAAASPHKFAWYHGDPSDYPDRLMGNTIQSAEAFGMMVEMTLSAATLVFSDGLRPRWHPAAGRIPKKHQLLLEFDDGNALSGAVSMWGGVWCWSEGDTLESGYYQTAREKPAPLSAEFDAAYFEALLASEDIRKGSLKAALATEQRIPGLGNGCLQDILFAASLNPRRKVQDLTDSERQTLFTSLKETLAEMARLGGRSTEKDLFNQPGGYPVVMFSKNKGNPCPRCGEIIIKESYMGGSVYFCPACQPRP